MKRITLAMLLVAITAAQAMAQDPVPPTPPARPATAPVPTAAPAPARATRPAPAPRALPARPFADFDADSFRAQAEEMSRMNLDMARMAPSAMDMDAIRAQSRDLTEQAREFSREAAEEARANSDQIREAARDAARMSVDAAREFAPFAAMAPMPPMAAIPPMPAFGPMPAGASFSGDRLFRAPPAPWAQGDPADSLYRVARNVLLSGDYGRAARLFADISQKYPKSVYANDAPYWEATARYRIGTTEELHNAAHILEPIVAKMSSSAAASGSSASTNSNAPASASNVSSDARGRAYGFGYSDGARRYNNNDNDVAALYARINGVLAQRGDRDAADKVAKAAGQTGGQSCDQEDMQVKIEALNALSQMDPATATPILRRVLDRKDDCSASLRRNAVFMIGRRTDTESANILIGVAKSDPNVSVRTSAIETLSRVPGDAGLNALEDMLRTDQDERIQRAVVSSLMRSDNVKARTSMRTLIDRKDAPVNLRVEAINSFNSDHATADDGAYLRGLYSKVDSDNLKRAIIDAVSRMGGSENDQWVLSLARNGNESSQIRSEAISRITRSNISIAEVGKLYDSADSYNIRAQLINVLRSRKDPEAADKLVDIAKNSTDYKLKTQALNALTSRNDPRSQQLVTDILEGKKP